MKYRLREIGIKVLYVPEVSATHFYRSNLLSFIKQEFKKGKGRYHLSKIWKGKIQRGPQPRIMSMANFRRLWARYGIKSITIFLIIFMKTRIGVLGINYERLLDALKA